MKKLITLIAAITFSVNVIAQSKISKNDEMFNAIMNNQKDKVELLLKAGCDPNYVKTGSPDIKVSALIAAVNNNYPEIAKMMLDAKADVNWKDNLDNNAIMYAASAGRLDMVKMLVEHGASLTTPNAEGNLVIDNARRSGNTELVNYIDAQMKKSTR
jgi:uncharacterized protein